MPSALIALYAGLFGLVIGSFLNVVIYRVPRGESLMGRSHCPGCDKRIAAYDNIPLLSWTLLRAKCRTCREPISSQYPLVEFCTGALFALVAWRFGISPITLTLLVFASFSVALFVIDLQTLRLPDILVLPTFVCAAVGVAASAAVIGDWSALGVAAASAAILGSSYFALWFVTGGRGLGFGDVKLAPSLGLILGYFGWGSFVTGTAAAWLLGAIVGILLILVGVTKRGKPIPFGPFLLVGCWVGIFFGQQVFDSYWSFMTSF